MHAFEQHRCMSALRILMRQLFDVCDETQPQAVIWRQIPKWVFFCDVALPACPAHLMLCISRECVAPRRVWSMDPKADCEEPEGQESCTASQEEGIARRAQHRQPRPQR